MLSVSVTTLTIAKFKWKISEHSIMFYSFNITGPVSFQFSSTFQQEIDLLL